MTHGTDPLFRSSQKQLTPTGTNRLGMVLSGGWGQRQRQIQNAIHQRQRIAIRPMNMKFSREVMGMNQLNGTSNASDAPPNVGTSYRDSKVSASYRGVGYPTLRVGG